jgi:hypothetical protein
MLGENVVGCPLGLYRWNLPDHFVQELVVDPRDVGFGLISRQRKLFFCTHKRRVQLVGSWSGVYSLICSHLQQGAFTSPSSCMLASPADLREEELAMAARRGVSIKPAPYPLQREDWSYLLTGPEWSRAVAYDKLRHERRVSPSTDVVYNLGDNPPERVTWSVVSGALPTYRQGCRIYWIPALCRWLTPLEKLASMGWPVFPDLAVASCCGLLRIPREVAARMVGNAVCIPNIGVAMLAALATCRLQ